MPEQDRWQLELSEYIRQGEPERAEKSAAWQTAIGLQAVDGLKTSSYLLETAKAHIEGDIDIAGAQRRIQSYYKEQSNRKAVEDGTMEADIVSARITELLGEKTFQFSPAELQSIHRRLFTGVFDHAGQFRTYNITKNEWVLGGDTVVYSSWESIRDTLDYDFSQEKQFSYDALSVPESIKHMAKFASGIWQIHPFCEGNTRATAVFILHGLKESDGALETICYVPCEEQATKWTPELRDRYFNALAACTEAVNVAYEKTVGCEFKAYMEAINEADTVIAVYDPNDPCCERETAAVTVAEMLNTQVVTVDPKAIHFF